MSEEFLCSSNDEKEFDDNYPRNIWSSGFKPIHHWVCSSDDSYKMITKDMVNLTNDKGWTPLHLVCSDIGSPNRTMIVKVLLDFNANPYLYANGYFPIHLAVVNGYYHIIELLLEYGVSPNPLTIKGSHCVSLTCNTDIIRLLIDYGICHHEPLPLHRKIKGKQIGNNLEHYNTDSKNRIIMENIKLKQRLELLETKFKKLQLLVEDGFGLVPDGERVQELEADFYKKSSEQ